MGMGKYQWELFALCGCGWMADNLWLQASNLQDYLHNLRLISDNRVLPLHYPNFPPSLE